MSMKGGITPNTLNKPSAKAPININPNVALIIEAFRLCLLIAIAMD